MIGNLTGIIVYMGIDELDEFAPIPDNSTTAPLKVNRKIMYTCTCCLQPRELDGLMYMGNLTIDVADNLANDNLSHLILANA